jgi:hypothetical protein
MLMGLLQPERYNELILFLSYVQLMLSCIKQLQPSLHILQSYPTVFNGIL